MGGGGGGGGIFWKNVKRMDHQKKNDTRERARGLGRNKGGDRMGNHSDARLVNHVIVTYVSCYSKFIDLGNSQNHQQFQKIYEIIVSLSDFMNSLKFLGIS